MEKKMGFFEAVSQVIRKSFVFKGRARRKEYWSWALFGFLLNIVVTVAVMMMSSSPTVQTWISGILALLMFFPGLSVAVRRLHDVDRSGWWIGGSYIVLAVYIAFTTIGGINGLAKFMMVFSMLFVCVCIFFGVLMLVWNFTEGTHGPNKYGDDPKRD